MVTHKVQKNPHKIPQTEQQQQNANKQRKKVEPLPLRLKKNIFYPPFFTAEIFKWSIKRQLYSFSVILTTGNLA